MIEKLLPLLFTVAVGLSKVAKKSKSEDYVLHSTGPASLYQGSTLGVYERIPEKQDMYKQKGGDYYLYKDKKDWVPQPRLANCKEPYIFSCIATWVASIKTSDIKGVGAVWSYGKNKTWVNDDPTLQFIPVSSNKVSCLRCNSVQLKSKDPSNSGVFRVMPGRYSAGRPVYKNKAGWFLMVKNEYSSYGVWDNPDKRLHAGKGDEGERFVRSGSAPTCVTQLGRHVGRAGHGWQVKTRGGDWDDHTATTARCVD